MKDFSAGALMVVIWTGASQLVLLLLKKEKDFRAYLSIFSLAYISYIFYAVIYEEILPLTYNLTEVFKNSNSYQLGTEEFLTIPEGIKAVMLIAFDSLTKLFLKFKFFRLWKSEGQPYAFLIETFNYLLLFTALTFSLLLTMMIIWLAWIFIAIQKVS